MATLSQAKTLGGIGSLLIILTVVPTAGAILGIVGFILVLLAVKNISDAVGDSSIFTNTIISAVLAIIGVVVGAIVVFASFLSFVGLGALAPGFSGPLTPGALTTGGIVGLIVGLILGLAVIWILLIVSAFFLRKSYNTIATKLGVGMFGTAALLYLIGAILTIILVGFIVIFVAGILQLIAFFSIPDQLPVSAAPPTQSAPTTPTS